MKYVILIQHNPTMRDRFMSLPIEERRAGLAAYTSLHEDLTESGELIASEALADPALGTRIPAQAGHEQEASLTRRAVRRGQGAPGRLLPGRLRQPGAGVRHRLPDPRGRVGHGRGAPGPGPQRLRDVRTGQDVEDLLRDLAPRILGALVRRYGGFDTCEDAVQEALLAAAVQWPRDGVPDNPHGWLITVASRRRTEMWRSETARRRREEAVVAMAATGPEPEPGRRSARRRGRHADPADALLPPVPQPLLAGRADAAGGRRPEYGGDRPGLADAGKDCGTTDQPGQAADQGERCDVPAAGARGAGRACGGRAAGALPDLQRGLHRELRRERSTGSSCPARRSG